MEFLANLIYLNATFQNHSKSSKKGVLVVFIKLIALFLIENLAGNIGHMPLRGPILRHRAACIMKTEIIETEVHFL